VRDMHNVTFFLVLVRIQIFNSLSFEKN
jgi:hypothetical protein